MLQGHDWVVMFCRRLLQLKPDRRARDPEAVSHHDVPEAVSLVQTDSILTGTTSHLAKVLFCACAGAQQGLLR